MHEQKYEIEEKNIKQPELKYPNSLDNALIVVSNLIARASTKWTLEETKMFLCMVSKVKTRDRDNWVTVSKKDLAEKCVKCFAKWYLNHLLISMERLKMTGCRESFLLVSSQQKKICLFNSIQPIFHFLINCRVISLSFIWNQS